MKNLLFCCLIASATVTSFTSCSGHPSSPQMESAKHSLDTWHLASFTSKGKDETSDFNTYTFSFEQPKSIIAYHNGISETGIYRELEDDSVKKGILVFSGTDPNLAKLIDKWDIVESTSSSLSLKRMRRSGMEEAHFIKGAETQPAQ